MLERPTHIVVPFVCSRDGTRLADLRIYHLRFWFNGSRYVFDAVVEPALPSVENRSATLSSSAVPVAFNDLDWCGFRCPVCGFASATMCRTHKLFVCAHELGAGRRDLWMPCEQLRQQVGGPTDVDVGAHVWRRSKAERMYKDLS
ncbi:MAG: hypothetical protein JW839_05870 [Candidatus Lokiarchaeota archaeon]|nr:hypothetical protein [Candidatus Lokiarchaeota archaeon]